MKGCRSQTVTETILLVEDQDLVRDVTQRIVERSGYVVLPAANGKEALSLYEKERDRISLVILDLIMPEMGGKDCLAKLRELNPKLKILVTSGYSGYGVEKEAIELGASAFLRKPYNMKQMLTAIREVLGSD
jgi:two-component system cell cycle sensor histidine kinase/response regulator CckA